MDDKKRVGFLGALKNMFVGVAKPEAYYRNGRFGRMSSAMLITFIMSTLTYLVIFFIPYNQLFGGGRFADRIDRNMEDFSLTGDGFYYDGTFDWSDDENMSYIKIDTSKTKVDEAVARDLAADGGYRTVFIISADEILTYNSGRTQIIRCKDIYESLNETYGFKAVTKQDVINLINKLDTPVLVLAWVLQIIVGFVLTLFWSLLITVAGLIAASMKNRGIIWHYLQICHIYKVIMVFPHDGHCNIHMAGEENDGDAGAFHICDIHICRCITVS